MSYFKSQNYQDDLTAVNEGAIAYRSFVGAQPRRANDAPPLITWGESPENLQLVIEDGKILEVTPRRGWGGDSAFIDWVNVTVHETTFSGEWSGVQVVADDQLILDCSALCEKVFGFGITGQRSSGANFYKRSYTLGDNLGMVCHGGQRQTLLIMLSGAGCSAALFGWEKRLHEFLTVRANSPKITRIDLAYDDYTGNIYTVDKAFEDFKNGNFTSRGRSPDCEQRGNWYKPNGNGRTFYVGHRTNGKFARIYEKGKQLGSKISDWVRCEVELKSIDRVLPFDILLLAGEYLSATYKALSWISEKSCRIATSQKTAKINYESMVGWLHRQCGAAIWSMTIIEGSIEKALDKIIQVGKVPARLIVPTHTSEIDFIHKRERVFISAECQIDAAFN